MKLFKIRQIFSPLFLESVNTMATEGAENSGESAEPLMTEQTNRQNVRILRVFATVIYSVFLLWEFVGSVLYTVRAVECSAGDKLESFHCGDIDTFSFSKELELAWYITRLVQMIFIVLAIQKLPDFLGYVATLRKLKTLPAFWTLLLLLMMGLVRYVILLALSKNLMTGVLTLFFILSCIFKFLIVGIVNYCQLNSLTQRNPRFVLVLVKITFIVILVQCVIDFCLAIMQLAFFADDFNKLKIGKSTNFRVVANLLRKSAECSFPIKLWISFGKNFLITTRTFFKKSTMFSQTRVLTRRLTYNRQMAKILTDKRPTNSYKFNRQLKFAFGCTVN